MILCRKQNKTMNSTNSKVMWIFGGGELKNEHSSPLVTWVIVGCRTGNSANPSPL